MSRKVAVPSWAESLGAGAPAPVVAEVVALAAARLAPERVRGSVARLLDMGAQVRAEAVCADLTGGLQAGRRPTEALVDAAARALLSADARVHVVGFPGYPPRLADAWPELGAPLWLFVRSPDGRLPAGPAVAVVGTRRPSLDGLCSARRLGSLLARHGVVVVSGMARGIDQAAHRGALEAGGATVAVLGTGFKVDYPSGDGELREAVAAAGGLVTEHLPGVAPAPRHFLWRNRIISGLADAVVVVEGRARSGALQTARLAAAQGREVLAMPGSVNQATAHAPLALIRDGARCVTRLEDVLDAVGTCGGDAGRDGHDARGKEPASDDPVARAVLDLLGPTPAAPGALAAATGYPVAAVLAALAELCSSGLCASTPRGVVACDAASVRPDASSRTASAWPDTLPRTAPVSPEAAS